MAKYRQRVLVSLKTQETPVYQWVQANTHNGLNDQIVRAYVTSGRIWEFIEHRSPEKSQSEQKLLVQYVEEWMNLYKQHALKRTTLSMYRSMLSVHILPVFGDRTIADISTQDIQQFLNDRKELSRKTLLSLKNLLGEIFKDAVEDGLADTDPTKSRRIVIPSTKVKIREALPLDEFKEILSGISGLAEDDRRLMALMLLTGMRRGEILGLRWEDIRLDEGLIYVQRNVTYAGNQPHVGTPKTSSGERMIPINDMLAEYLQPFQQEGFILGGEKPITEMSYKRRMYRIGKQINLHNATAHVFRHSYLTYVAGTGTDVKTLQAIAGHADIQMTMNRYVHKQTDHIIDAGSRMQALLST